MRIRERFNPRAPCGARRSTSERRTPHEYFNPRAPCGARLPTSSKRHKSPTFQPTRPLRGATLMRRMRRSRTRNFNPRAPCGARRSRLMTSLTTLDFNPRAPCGARPADQRETERGKIFQPTRPLRGATVSHLAPVSLEREISTHAPLAGRDAVGTDDGLNAAKISTHAPLAGRDLALRLDMLAGTISTHAPLAGRDRKSESE